MNGELVSFPKHTTSTPSRLYEANRHLLSVSLVCWREKSSWFSNRRRTPLVIRTLLGRSAGGLLGRSPGARRRGGGRTGSPYDNVDDVTATWPGGYCILFGTRAGLSGRVEAIGVGEGIEGVGGTVEGSRLKGVAADTLLLPAPMLLAALC